MKAIKKLKRLKLRSLVLEIRNVRRQGSKVKVSRFTSDISRVNKFKTLKMKMNWGYKILFVYISFVLGIIFLVFKASQEKFDLVTPNYYEAELKFQDVINDKQRVTQLSTPPKITHSVNSVRIQFPGEFLNKQVKGELYLYRASDATKDFRKKFATDQNFIDITLDQNFSGSYEVKLSWEAEGKTFYNEQRIFF